MIQRRSRASQPDHRLALTAAALGAAVLLASNGAVLAWDKDVHPWLNRLGDCLVKQSDAAEMRYSEIYRHDPANTTCVGYNMSCDEYGTADDCKASFPFGDHPGDPFPFIEAVARGGLDEDENPDDMDGTSGPHHCSREITFLDPLGLGYGTKPAFARSRKHFYHPVSEVGLSDRIVYRKLESGRCKSAVQWARDDDNQFYTWRGAISSYGYSRAEKVEAYYRLGHVAHLIGDMSQPDHVHLEPHSFANMVSHLSGGLDKYGLTDWTPGALFSDGVRPDTASLKPTRYDHMEEHLTELAMTTFDASRFSARLRTNSFHPINEGSQLDQMFDIDYIPGPCIPHFDPWPPKVWYTCSVGFWDVENYFGYNSFGTVGNWDPPYSDDDEMFATNGLPQAPNNDPDYYYIETHDGGLNRDAVPRKYKQLNTDTGTFSMQENGDKHTLQYWYAKQLMPLSVQNIAGASCTSTTS